MLLRLSGLRWSASGDYFGTAFAGSQEIRYGKNRQQSPPDIEVLHWLFSDFFLVRDFQTILYLSTPT
jgi:hypothetical protein